MKSLKVALLSLLVCLICVPSFAASGNGKVRVLLVTGGHDFEREPFLKVFKDNPDISFKAVEHPNAHALWTADGAKQWDVLVCYDMNQPITDEAKANLVARLKEGKGLVVLHHAIASYQAWPEYEKIIGAKYYLEKTNRNGVEKPRSLWKHDVDIQVHVADPSHPVTAGVKDFVIHDESYKLYDVADDVHPLLQTDEPLNNHTLSWAKQYARARVVYLQLGHDHQAYENPNYQKLLRQAINWTGHKSDASMQ